MLGLVLSGWAGAGPRDPRAPCPAQVEQEPNETTATASPVVLHDPTYGMFSGIRGAIDTAGDVDWYSFSAPAGARLWLAVDTGVASAGDRDSSLAVFGPDGTSLLEQDADDGTGNGRDFTVESLDASLIAGLVLPSAGTYYARVRAASPAASIDRYVLMVAVTSPAPQPEVEPNDTWPGQMVYAAPVLGSLSSASDVDYYMAGILDFGLPFMVVDADPERDGTGTDISLRFEMVQTVTADSSGLGGPSDPPAEGLAVLGLGSARVTGTGPGTYLIGIWYSGEFCPVPVELQGFEIH